MKNDIFMDLTSIEYLWEMIVWLLTFFLFLWWACYKKIVTRRSNKIRIIIDPKKVLNENVSVIYILVMLGFLTQAYATSIAYYARLLRDYPVAHYDFLNSFWWHTRILPRLIIGTIISVRMMTKVYVEFFASKKRRPSNLDKDGDDV